MNAAFTAIRSRRSWRDDDREIKSVLDQLADAGVFFLTFSGGEVFLRRDFLELVAYARRLLFNVKVKTNAAMIREPEARKLRELGIENIQISVYSHRPEVHDAITKLPGSLNRTIKAIRFLKSQGLRVTIANVLMKWNLHDHTGVHALAEELGAIYALDPTITPKIDGDTSILDLRIPGEELRQVFRIEKLVGNVEEFCAPPPPPGADELDSYPCSAGHTLAYISPYGDVYLCQFPLPSGNVRKQKFIDICALPERTKFVPSPRATCLFARLAVMLGPARAARPCLHGRNMRGPSTADCEKSFQRQVFPARI